jgi:putative FmdB family regulatory protein
MTYEYVCKKCQYQFLTEQSIKDEPLCVCPKCDNQSLQRLISSGTNFVLNGSGWAKDNYSNKK